MSSVIPTPSLCLIQAAFASLSHLWMDRRISRNMKLRLCNMCVCTTLTHACEEWNLTKAVSRILNGFNSRCLHVITRVGPTVIPPFLEHKTCCWPYNSDVSVTCDTCYVSRVTVWCAEHYLPWRMETTQSAIRKGVYSWTARVQNWKTLRPWQWTTLHGGTKWRHLCFTVTLHHWTHWVHYEHDDDDG